MGCCLFVGRQRNMKLRELYRTIRNRIQRVTVAIAGSLS